MLVGLTLVTGCQSKDAADPTKAGSAPAARSTKGGGLANLNPPPPAPTNSAAGIPVVLPTSGRIHSVNTGLRFAVIDYTLGGMPDIGALLYVYRNNEKVGQIRLSGPEPRNGFITGDVVEGFIQIDDEVRIH